MTNLTKIAGLENIIYFHSDMYVSLANLDKNNYRIASLEENAGLRIKSPDSKGNPTLNSEVLTNNAFIYVPSKGIFLSKNHPFFDNIRKKNKRFFLLKGREHYLTKNQLEKALDGSIMLSLNKAIISIPLNRLGEEEITSSAFGDFAEDYGLFLREKGEDLSLKLEVEGLKRRVTAELKKPENISIILDVNLGKKPFVAPISLDGINRASDVDGRFKDPSWSYDIVGIKKEKLERERSISSQEKGDEMFRLWIKMGKDIDNLVNRERYEEVTRLKKERDDLYKKFLG